MSPFEVIIRHSVDLERILSQTLGAKGSDLHAKLNSLRPCLPAELSAQIEYLIVVRDQAVNTAVVPDDAAGYERIFTGVIHSLERIVGPTGHGTAIKTPSTPASPHIEPTSAPASPAWQLAQQDVAEELMLSALLSYGGHESQTNVSEEALPSVEIRETNDATETPTPLKEISLGSLLLRPSADSRDTAQPSPAKASAPQDKTESSTARKEISLSSLLIRPSA
ncbi:hypothetical protein BJI67_02415 [Acidihalobacter aeolianus]|uniref:Uncharacterized protein n=1 Tax=Acidihalobacter aeolianus TaxID=2792603 RepID=A0A1D8K542_9GAMM|nr:hypothetical protein [Acidihalobacter aeolianus]AOV16073.1 hypothetical protein BJI67_02415 [Acidihalobacter aeolianus]